MITRTRTPLSNPKMAVDLGIVIMLDSLFFLITASNPTFWLEFSTDTLNLDMGMYIQ